MDESTHDGGARRGRLSGRTGWPAAGERFVPLATLGGVRVEEILSGRDVQPEDYDQAHDEWVVLLEGAATLTTAGERVELTAGDWILLPAHTRHRVEWIEPGSRWLALHGDA